ncbi:hypothetical protein V5N11_015934 [Cardamine amara subsp. amara]|uniref:MBD domain-containing protein n=1 Tax=Cardamine amara subsp. amara TaxID=228776 RepID=A0ABD1BHV2_CARAN
MLRQLPLTITADSTPDWLPVGWIVHSTVLKRGRQTKTYTQLGTGKKFFTKDHVLEYIKMEKILEERESVIERKKAKVKAFKDRETVRERPSLLPSDWKAEMRIGSVGGNQYNMYVNTSKESAFLFENIVELSEASSSEEDEIECNQISYAIEENEEDFSESEYVADKGLPEEDVEILSYVNSTSLRSQPERIQKSESRAKTQCLFEIEDMSSDSDNKLPEAETSKEENGSGEACVVFNVVESFEEKNLHDVVVECDDKAREIPGLTGSFTIEINLDCELASDSLVQKDWNENGTEGIGTRNIEIIDIESDMMHISASSKVVELTQELGDKSEEPLEAQAVQEETENESRTSVIFPFREAPHSVLGFDNSNARSSAEDLSNTTQLCLNTQEKNISGTKKRKKNAKECSSKNIKKKDIEAPTKKPDDWPEPCPNFPFEPLTSSSRIEDDSVIRRYLEEHFAAAGSVDSNLPLPDFGLSSFSNIKISLNEEPESKRKKSPGPPCVQVASSSLPSCSSIGTSMQQTVAGN